MLLQTLIPIFTLLFSTATACAGHITTRNLNSTTNETITDPVEAESPIQFGPDTPTSPETTGYFQNHISLNVANLTASMNFYTSVFGMRHIFTYNPTKHVSFTYMSHSQGGRNGSAYQTTSEIFRQKNNNAGHLELMYLDVPKSERPSPTIPQKWNTLNHIGFIVPDLELAQRRLEQFGVTIYKKIGEAVSEDGYLGDKYWLGGDATNLDDEEFAQIRETMGFLNRFTIFAADPDGNLLEIHPLNEASLA